VGVFLNRTSEFPAWPIYGSGLQGCNNRARNVRRYGSKGNCEGLPQRSGGRRRRRRHIPRQPRVQRGPRAAGATIVYRFARVSGGETGANGL
jgi:hypothetical protein